MERIISRLKELGIPVVEIGLIEQTIEKRKMESENVIKAISAQEA